MADLVALFLSVSISIAVAPPSAEFMTAAGGNINGLPLSDPQGLAVNSRNEEFLVADALNDRIVIIDTTGAAVFAFTLGENRHNPFGLAVNNEEEIIISPMDNSELWVYDYTGRYLNSITLPEGIAPGRLVIGSDDSIYLVNRAGNDIIVIDKNGNVIQTFVSGDPKCKPSGVAFDGKNNILLTSFDGIALTVFNPDGKISYTFGEHGQSVDEFSHPTASAVDAEGDIWIVDSFRHQIKRFDPNHKYLDTFGNRGTASGDFYFPVDLKITSGGKLGVLEKGTGRLQIFRLNYAK